MPVKWVANRDKFPPASTTHLPTLTSALAALIVLGMVQQGGGRRGPRSKLKIERERIQAYERTSREVDGVVAAFHAMMPRTSATVVGAIYCRYSTRHQDSIVDQVRKILEDAVRRKVFIPREHVFFDLAVRGYKSQRAGLDHVRSLAVR